MRAHPPLLFGPSRLPHRALGRQGQIAFGFAFAVAITLLAIVQSVAAERSVTDATGRTVTIGKAERIVTIGGDITEIVYALGAGDRVIGRDSTSLYPETALAKPDVGYMRALSAEGVLSIRPDLILAVQGSGPKEAMDLLESASVPIVVVPEAYSAAGIGAKIAMIADILGETEKGRVLSATVAARFAEVDAALAKLGPDKRRKAVFLMSLAADKPLAAGNHTAADAVLAMAGAINPMHAVEGYKPASDEALAAAAPDTIVMMTRPGMPAAEPETVFAVPSLRATPAAQSKSLIVMDGLYLLGFGPRTADAVRDLAQALYPELGLPAPAAN